MFYRVESYVHTVAKSFNSRGVCILVTFFIPDEFASCIQYFVLFDFGECQSQQMCSHEN